jgi:Protein of unknown function (DUF3467)
MVDNQVHDQENVVPGVVSRVRRHHADDVPELYANNVSFSTSVWDFTLDFGMLLGIDDEGTLNIQDLARVIMSPQQAKAFSQVLAENVAQYEGQFGSIPVPAFPTEAAAATRPED